MRDLYDVVAKGPVPKKNDKPNRGNPTTGEQAFLLRDVQSECCSLKTPSPLGQCVW